MTKKDYELIAIALRCSKPGEPERALAQHDTWLAYNAQWEDTVDLVMKALAQDNPRFDRQKFLAVCGIPQPVVQPTEKRYRQLSQRH